MRHRHDDGMSLTLFKVGDGSETRGYDHSLDSSGLSGAVLISSLPLHPTR